MLWCAPSAGAARLSGRCRVSRGGEAAAAGRAPHAPRQVADGSKRRRSCDARQSMAFNADVAARYDRWFETPWGSYADRAQRRLLRVLARPLPGERALDVGCGTGRYVGWLCGHGLDATGVDLSRAMIARASERVRAGRVLVGDAEALPFEDGSFDLVTGITALEFTAHPRRVLGEMVRVCRGRVFLGVLSRVSMYGLQLRAKGERSSFAGMHAYSVGELLGLVKEMAGVRELTWRTTLLGPEGHSPEGVELANALDRLPGVDRLPLGAFIGVVGKVG